MSLLEGDVVCGATNDWFKAFNKLPVGDDVILRRLAIETEITRILAGMKAYDI